VFVFLSSFFAICCPFEKEEKRKKKIDNHQEKEERERGKKWLKKNKINLRTWFIFFVSAQKWSI